MKKDRWVHAENCGGRKSKSILHAYEKLCPKYWNSLGFGRATCYESLTLLQISNMYKASFGELTKEIN